MALRLKGATSGFVELNAPDEAGSNTLTLPDGNGTSGQYLQTNGSGGLSWQTVPNNGFESYAVIADQKTLGTDGGTFTSGDWRTRDLNTELFDPDGIVSISSNQFTLGAGTYFITFSAPAHVANRHNARLYDVTNSSVEATGTSAIAANASGVNNTSFGFGRVTITANTTYEIQHQCQTTVPTNGFGVGCDHTTETYTVVEIFREA